MGIPVFEVEIRMDVPKRKISDIQFDKRTRDTVAILERSGPVEYRRLTHPMSFTTMRLFMARVQASTWDLEALYGLSERLHQDFISVYSPSRKEGAYIGPGAAARGEFELRSFSRFDPEAVRREAMARPVDPAYVALLREYALKVFTANELATMAHQPRSMFFSMLDRRLSESGPPPTVDEVDGFKELATVHLWCDAMTVVANSLPEKPQ